MQRTAALDRERALPLLSARAFAALAIAFSAALFLLAVVPLILLGLNIWPAADDYSFWLAVPLSGSPFEYALMRYVTWSGRLLVEFSGGLVYARPELHQLLSLVGPLAFGATPLAFLWGLHQFGVRIGRGAGLVAATIGLAAMWFGLAPYLAECVFWLIGGFQYATPLLLGALWLAALFRVQTFGVWQLALLGASGLILCTAHEQLSAGLVLAALTYSLLHRLQRSTFAAVLLPLLLGSMVLYLAPGNALRADYGPQGLTVSPVALLVNYLTLTPALATRSIAPMLAGALAGAACALVADGHAIPKRRLLAWSLVLFSASIGSTAPLSAVPDFLWGVRTGFFPAAFAFFAAAGLGVTALGSVPLRRRSIRLLAGSIAALFVGAYFQVAAEQVRIAYAVRPELEARFQLLAHADPSADIVLPRLSVPTPNVIHTPEMSVDPTYWANRAAARYFGIRSVSGHLGEDIAPSP